MGASRSNKEVRRASPLDRLDPSRRAEAEARAASRKPNEAIKVPAMKPAPSEASEQGLTSHSLGTGAAARALQAMKARNKGI